MIRSSVTDIAHIIALGEGKGEGVRGKSCGKESLTPTWHSFPKKLLLLSCLLEEEGKSLSSFANKKNLLASSTDYQPEASSYRFAAKGW